MWLRKLLKPELLSDYTTSEINIFDSELIFLMNNIIYHSENKQRHNGLYKWGI